MSRHWMDEEPVKISANGRSNEIERLLSDLQEDNVDVYHTKQGERYYFRTPLKSGDRYKVLSDKLKNLRECLAWLAGFKIGFAWGAQRQSFKIPRKETRLLGIPLVNSSLQNLFRGFDSHSFQCDSFDFLMGCYSESRDEHVHHLEKDIWVILDMSNEIPVIAYSAEGPMYWCLFNFLQESCKFKKLSEDEVAQCVWSFFFDMTPFVVTRDVVKGERYMINAMRGIMYTPKDQRDDQVTESLPKYLKGLREDG